MQKKALPAVARHELAKARAASSGRSAATIFGGHEHRLRQTVIALRAGESMSEHPNPGEATVQVLQGRVLMRSGETSWNGSAGDLMIIPDGMHALDAVEDSVVLLTVVKLG